MTGGPMRRRREFITLLGSAAAAWPVAAGAQQPPARIVGYLDLGAPETNVHLTAAFRRGLAEGGYIEGRNITIEFRFANNDVNRLAELAADLVRRRVAVIAIPASTTAALVAKATTPTIPIVFGGGSDPVRAGLVASLNRPGGNVTGFSNMGVELTAKQIGLLNVLLPQAKRFAVLRNPATIRDSVNDPIADIPRTASTSGAQFELFDADNRADIDLAFAAIARSRADALLVITSPLFTSRRVQIATLAVRHLLPTLFTFRESVEAGGLMSYGASITDQVRQIGVYTARVLKGEKPSDLPVQRPTKFEFVINLQTAKTLGIELPPTLLAIADEVIE
jgi:putative ABC transport system substrate-binding protein